MKTIYIDDFPILLCADSHGHVANLDKARAKHPECKQRFFLGDLGDFVDETFNQDAHKWLEKNINDWEFILGNHDKENYHVDLSMTLEQKKLIERHFCISVKLVRPDGKYHILCHSKPKDIWGFINVGYSFREFDADFSCVGDENFISCINGHTHRPLKHVFQETDSEIWTIGAAKDRKYAILTKKGIEFKKL